MELSIASRFRERIDVEARKWRARHEWKTRLAYNHHIYVPELDLVYFFVPKVGCTSVKSLIAEIMGVPVTDSVHSVEFPKLPYSAIQSREYGDSFAIVRNPLYRLYSAYKSMVLRDRDDDEYINGVFRPLAKYGSFYYEMSFHEFCREIAKIPDRSADPHFASQSCFLTDRKGRVRPKTILSFKDFESNVKNLFGDKYGLAVEVGHRNKAKGPELDVSQETMRIIRKRYRRDFKLFDEYATSYSRRHAS